MPARLSAFVIWALVGAGSVFWAYRFWAPRVALPANVQLVGESAGQRGDLTRLLGGAAVPVDDEDVADAPAAPSSRFRLLGVLAPKPASPAAAARSKVGVALIAVDGKPARAFAVGARVDGDLVLMAVSHRSASIGPAQGTPSMVLELPPLPPPSTATLPRPAIGGEPARAGLPGVAPPVASPPGAPGGPPRSPASLVQRPTPQPQAAEDSEDDEPAPSAPPRAGATANPAIR